ncbi:MAG: hypothetical protein ACRDSL_13255 [Pseudonocardiaceae bacterium]
MHPHRAETELVGATLGLSIPEAIPSAELEQRLLAVTTTAQASPVMPPAPSTPPAPHSVPAVPHCMPQVTTPATSLPGRAPRRRNRREPLCVPETLKLILAALLVLAFAFATVFYAVP